MSDIFPTAPGSIRFRTGMFLMAGTNIPGFQGHLDFHFFTPEGGPNYATEFTPEGLSDLYSNLTLRLAQIGPLPKVAVPMGFGPSGEIKPSATTKVYFGQTYDTEVLEALGVLMIRANLLDHGLIGMYSGITGANLEQASNQYYASTNMKARLDVIRSLASGTDLPESLHKSIIDCLDEVKKVSDRRNDLVHARWSFRNGKHRAEVFKPNSKNKKIELTVTPRMVLLLAEDYQTAAVLLLSTHQALGRWRSADSKTALTPSSTEPSS